MVKKMISVIIVNWNSYRYLCDCIRFLCRANEMTKCEVIVFDNNSKERDVENLHEFFPDVKVVFSKQNLGFARANNYAAKIAQGDIMLFLNPDTLVRTGFLEAFYDFFLCHENVAVIGPKILNKYGKVSTDAPRRFPSLFVTFCNLVLIDKILNRYFNSCSEFITDIDKTQQVDVLSGACMAIRRDVFNELGGFSTDYFMYTEETDLCYRAVMRGYKNYYLADHVVTHFGGKSSQKTKNAKLFEVCYFNSRRIFFKKKGATSFLILNFIYIFGSIVRIIVEGIIFLFACINQNNAKSQEAKDILGKYWRILLMALGFNVIDEVITR